MNSILCRIKRYRTQRIIAKEGGQLYSETARKIALTHGVEIDLYTYGSCFDEQFAVSGKCHVGRYCSIASDVHYLGANHPMSSITSSAIFYNSNLSGFNVKDIKREELYIGHDVWIGHGVLITASCHSIGNGAIIGAGSVVTKDIPPYAIYAGNPARLIRYRFDEKTIEQIEMTKWWDHSPNELIDYYDYMHNPRQFCECFCQRNDKTKE